MEEIKNDIPSPEDFEPITAKEDKKEKKSNSNGPVNYKRKKK